MSRRRCFRCGRFCRSGTWVVWAAMSLLGHRVAPYANSGLYATVVAPACPWHTGESYGIG